MAGASRPIRRRGADPRARAGVGAHDVRVGDLGGSVQAVGLRARARIGRVLTAEDPKRYPKATVARLLGVSRQALYHRPAVEAVEAVEAGVVVHGPWPDRGPPLSDDLVTEAHILDVCRDRPRFGTRRVTAWSAGAWAGRAPRAAS